MPDSPTTSTASELLYFNGINGATGDYIQAPLNKAEVARLALSEVIDPKQLQELKFKNRQSKEATFAVVEGIDPTRLDQAGWGVVFAADTPGSPFPAPALKEALQELLDHRRGQATKVNAKFYKEFIGKDAFRPNESKQEFLARQGVGPGPADPAKGVPYYLLIVGSPEAIPFRIQYQLDVQYAVGRIWFDTLEEYRNYAHSVVSTETGKVRLARKATFFGVRNPGDPSTQLSAAELVEPLGKALTPASTDTAAWQIQTAIGEGQATKARLARLLGGDETPALLFTASHGMGFPLGDPRQLPHQGALLCQDWPGRAAWHQPIPTDHYFAADDVGDGANLAGLIAFHFACYGAGTPNRNDFAHTPAAIPDFSTPKPIVARLPRRLLGHPKGGALAIVGHVDRAWGCSFTWPGAGRQLQCFQDALKRLMNGQPVGAAMENFNLRYAELSSDLSVEIEDVKFGKLADEDALAGMWTANNDARSYIILGDPAVRLSLATDAAPPTAREIAVIRPSSPAPEPDSSSAPFTAPASPDGAPALGIPVTETEKRYRERQDARESVAYSPGVHPILQRNSQERLRKRLRELGVPAADIQAMMSGGSFAVLPKPGAPLESPQLLLERIIGRNDLIGAEFLDRGARAAQAVARITIRSPGGRKIGYGTGSLIAPLLLLTNNHVLNTLENAAASTIEFNVQDGSDGTPLKPELFALAPQDFFFTDPVLDFTVVAVGQSSNGTSPLTGFGFNKARPDDDPVLVEEYVNIIQHPNGQPKQLALRDNQVVDLLADFLHYRADTQPGSSGAPVFNDQWQVVALHHSGVPKRNSQNEILARNGEVWRAEMGEDQIDWIANEGVRLSRILQHIKDLTMSNDTQRRLRDSLFESTAPAPVHPAERSSVAVPTGVPAAPSAPDSAKPQGSAAPSPTGTVGIAGADGSVTLTIPLQISVRLGGLGSGTQVLSGPVSAPAQPAEAAFQEAVVIDKDYDSREGFDTEFMGRGALAVPLPTLSAAQKKDAVVVEGLEGDDAHELKYHHYSVVFNTKRRLAFFTAVNIDGRISRKPKRDPDKWFFDPRVPQAQQIANDFYKGSVFDRGHLVRRLDPAWGRTETVAKVANDDTFHFTNCSPQHKKFNEGKNLWAGLEDFLLNRATDKSKLLIVFTGPVFTKNDPHFRDVQIPKQFWKVAVMVRPNGKLAALGFVVDQSDLIAPVVEEAAIDVARTFQVPIRKLEAMTGLDFGQLRTLEADSVDGFGLEAAAVPLESYDDIMIPEGEDSEPAREGAVSFAVAESATEAPSDGYYFVAYDETGNERSDVTGGSVSARVEAAIREGTATDVILFSHGWLNDAVSAKASYAKWIESMRSVPDDLTAMRQARSGFEPLLVGLHWPSQPWGDEQLNDNPSFAIDEAGPADRLVNSFASRLGGGAGVREPLEQVIRLALDAGEPTKMPKPLVDAYEKLNAALGLKYLGVGAAPGSESEVFDPQAIYQEALAQSAATVSFSLINRDTLLDPLRTLSFWKMKDRARVIGEGAVHQLLTKLLLATGDRQVRFHLIGHSFGCILTSAGIAGPPNGPGLPRPVDSLVLLQGALSLWAYCSSIGVAKGQPGYFNRMIAAGKVRGPLVTTQSRYDTAVGSWYPKGAQIARQVAFAIDEFPKYGGVGAFGIQGPGVAIENLPMLPANGTYTFRAGQVHNLEGSAYIRKSLSFVSGAHSDICHPEVAHAIWSAWKGT